MLKNVELRAYNYKVEAKSQLLLTKHITEIIIHY